MKLLASATLAALVLACANAQHYPHPRPLVLPKVVELTSAAKIAALKAAGLNYPQLTGVCTFTPSQMYDAKNQVELQVQGGIYSGQGPTIELGYILHSCSLTVDGAIDPGKNYLVTFYGENMNNKAATVNVYGGHQNDTIKIPKGTFSIPMVYFQRKGFPDFGVALNMGSSGDAGVYIYKVTVEKAG